MKNSSVKNQLFSYVIISFCAFVNVSATSNENVPEEIAELFNYGNKNLNVINENGPLGFVNNKIYAEGSSGTVNKPHNLTNRTAGVISKHGKKSNPVQSINEKHNVTQLGKLIKLNTTLDFLSSIHETAHGTSSIKPRKGVSYNKIVPKKGVSFEEFLNYSIPSNHSCFFLNKSSCYDVDYYSNLKCNCCNESNDLGKIISRQPLINCTSCVPINELNFEVCAGICCKNLTQNITEKQDNITAKIYEVYENQKFLSFNLTEKDHVKKKKPSVTNVPYDSDIINAFSKSKGEKYVPIVVSIFILPLVGVLIFFMWRKTQELWDRRYYKRMDFLIDGMYNE